MTASMCQESMVLNVDNLQVQFSHAPMPVLDNISLAIKSGQTLAVVGESGCGKSITSLALMGLLPPNAKVITGNLELDGTDLTQLSEREFADFRGRQVAMIFQEPMTSLNPSFTLGNQLMEAALRHQALTGPQAKALALDMLKKVQIPDPLARMGNYPHQLSGGMRQRIMIAMALINGPRLLIADEPTTALDVTIQAQILQLLRQLQRDTGSAILLITHDLGVVAQMAHHVAVMYAGQIVEQGAVLEIFNDPQHPYTIGLMGSIPMLSAHGGKLSTIPGTVPQLHEMPAGCRFATRCPFADHHCRHHRPQLENLTPEHQVACFKAPLEENISAEVAQ
ncbi:ABC transporter ATP-binding protein [Sodalis ligni]|uniref:ABC transporter ATP-binding protein n=1 Tax=unclassified Sodalis (in: enterobacteria) TaxID=2636512 RepID=UPI00193FD28B